MKKAVSFLMALVMTLSVLSGLITAQAADPKAEVFTEVLIDDAAATVGAEPQASDSEYDPETGLNFTIVDDHAVVARTFSLRGSLAIPASFRGYPVTEIGEYALPGNNITEVIMPDSVHRIGDRAFSNCALTRVRFSEALESIGSYAFEGCDNLEKLDLPDGLKEIRFGAFWDTASTLLCLLKLS